MKKIILSVAVVLMGATSVFANEVENNTSIEMKQTTKTSTFGVRGNCGMCKKTIEAAANSIEGVESATWDKDKKVITVVYSSKVSLMDIHKAIAASGYDTEKVKADKKAYNNLAGCCQYDREQEMNQEGGEGENHGHSHEGHHH